MPTSKRRWRIRAFIAALAPPVHQEFTQVRSSDMTKTGWALLLAAGASILECTCAFTTLPATTSAALRRASSSACTTSCLSRGKKVSSRHVLAVMPLPHDADAPHVDLGSLPEDIRAVIAGLSLDMRRRLDTVVAERLMGDALEHRAVMEEQADVGANLACKIYFQSIKDSHQYGDQRLSRKHCDNAEKAHINLKKNHVRPHDHGFMKNIANIMHHTPTHLGSIASSHSFAKAPVAAPAAAPAVHLSVAATLGMLGVQHRIDFTNHDGARYMDVVTELRSHGIEGEGVRGLVIQILPVGHRPSYVSIKKEALREDEWAVITVKPAEWVRMVTMEARCEWLTTKLVKSGFWSEANVVAQVDRPLKKALALKHMLRALQA